VTPRPIQLSGLIVYFEGPPAGVNEYIDDVELRW